MMKKLRIQARQDLQQIRRLVQDWNPFGIPDLPEDEYSCAEFRIYRKLLDGVSNDDLEECLNEWMTGHAGLRLTPTDQAHNRHHAEAIMAWWKQRQKNLNH